MTCREGHAPRHEDFAPGNEVAVKHGARSDRLVRPRALEIAADLAADDALPDYLRQATYRPALLAYATTLARAERVQVWLEATAPEHGVPELDEAGDVRGATRLLERLEGSAARQRQELGLTPLSRARLGKDVAVAQVSLAQIWSDMDNEQNEASQ